MPITHSSTVLFPKSDMAATHDLPCGGQFHKLHLEVLACEVALPTLSSYKRYVHP